MPGFSKLSLQRKSLSVLNLLGGNLPFPYHVSPTDVLSVSSVNQECSFRVTFPNS